MKARKLRNEVSIRGPNTNDHKGAVRVFGRRCAIKIHTGGSDYRHCLAPMECVLKIGTEVPVPCCAEHRRFYVGLNDQEKAEKAAAFLAKQVRMFDE